MRDCRFAISFPRRRTVSESTDKTGNKAAPLPWVLLSGFLGIFAINTPVSPTGTTAKNADKKETAIESPFQISGKDPLKPIYDFYATHDGHWNPQQDLKQNLHNYKVEFLIATVPDPIDTPYGHSFDQVVDAIQRAVEKKDGYLLDRSWLPWEFDKKPKAGKQDDEDKLFGHYREAYPGVLLFRHGKHADRKVKDSGICIVFLVGETPMGGLHKRAFTKALQMMNAAGHPEDQPVRIVGPYFTGSQTSLQFVVGDWWASTSTLPMIKSLYPFEVVMRPQNPLYKFDVITGSATALRPADFFNIDPYKDGHLSWQADRFSLSSTVVPTRTVISAMMRYLTRRDGCASNEPVVRSLSHIPGKIAILTEGNTGFGKGISTLNKQEILMLRFPLHISRVKNEYTQAFKKKDEKDGLKNMDSLVPSALDEQYHASEGVPSQGGGTTAMANAQVLSNILATISREQCKYVGVIATDARDKLFLVRLIREFCPDVRIFVTDADQLLLHPDYRYHMRGVVVGSTYPLIAQNQTWVNPETRDRVLFATVAAQGCYNAGLFHMGAHKELLEYAPPAFIEREADADPRIWQRPPIWISTISPNGSLVPLQVFTEYEDKTSLMRLNTAAKVPDESGIALSYPGAMLPIGIGLLAFWLFLSTQALFSRSSRMFWEPAGSNKSEFSLPQLFYRNLLLGSQAVLTMPVLALVWTHGHSLEFQTVGSKVLVGLTIALSGCFLLGMLKPLCWPPSRIGQFAQWLKPRKLDGGRLELATWALANVLLILIVVGFGALFLGRFWGYGGDTRRSLFFLRAVDLSSGMSPLTPIFFMSTGFAAWAFFQLKRAQQIDRYVVPAPFPAGFGSDATEGAFARITDLDRHVQDEVRHESLGLRHPKAILLTTLALLSLGLAVWLQSLPTIEGWGWDGIFFAGFWLLFALSASILVRLFFLWRQTKKLLSAISLVPMMRAFGRLPAKVADLFGKYLFAQSPKLEHLQLPLHQVRLLANAAAADANAPPELADLGRACEVLDKRLQEGLDESTDRVAAQRAERDLRGKLSAIAATCLVALAPRWKSLPVEDAYGDGTKVKDDKAKAEANAEPAWVLLAENVVATQIIIYVSQFFAQLRGLVVAAMVCTSLLLLSATSYSFNPERLLLVSLLGLSATGLAAVIWVLLEMNRDEVVSRILKTTPGKLSLDSGFVGSFLTYVVPTVGILAAQLSGSFRWLLEPILHVMK